MSPREHLHSVVASLQPVVQGVSEDQLGAPTPCEEWTVRDLVNHMLGTGDSMRRMGAGEPLDAQDPWGTDGDHVTDTWRDDLSARLIAVADAWAQPGAWQGQAMDGAVEREQIGKMAYVELVLHGWDLARATGQELHLDDAAVAEGVEVMGEIGEQGRQMGAFGPELHRGDDEHDGQKDSADNDDNDDHDDSADSVDRDGSLATADLPTLLARAGRDADWKP